MTAATRYPGTSAQPNPGSGTGSGTATASGAATSDPGDPTKMLRVLLGVAQERVDAAQAALAAARLTRARIAARLADECGLTHEAIAKLLPRLSRQRAGQLIGQGRLALDDTVGQASPVADSALSTAEGTRSARTPYSQRPEEVPSAALSPEFPERL